MDLKLFLTVLGTVFLAEIADKTQIATLVYASNSPTQKLTVFAGSALALALASALAVFAGGWIGQSLDGRLVSRVAGVAFIAIGVWTLWRG
jgi:putative Ca2+/H+ antiporter (TMEM165/GDT1 family)